MSNFPEVPIIEVRATGPTVKDQHPTLRWYKWSTPLVYVLADGTEHTGTERTSTRKEAAPHIEGYDRAAKNGRLAATFHEGRFIGTRQLIGLGRLA